MKGISYLPDTLQGSFGQMHDQEHIWFLVNRAYQNIYGMNMPNDKTYQHTILEAASALHRDERSSKLSDKMFMQACEDLIRICDEHHRKAEKHLARAKNPLYLREMALDNALERQRYQEAVGELLPNSAVIIGHSSSYHTELKGRVRACTKPSSAEIMDLAYQQLALNAQHRSE